MVYSYIHNNSKFAETVNTMSQVIKDIDIEDYKISQNNQLQLIRAYIELASTKAQKVHSALESYLELREKEELKNKAQNSY